MCIEYQIDKFLLSVPKDFGDLKLKRVHNIVLNKKEDSTIPSRPPT